MCGFAAPFRWEHVAAGRRKDRQVLPAVSALWRMPWPKQLGCPAFDAAPPGGIPGVDNLKVSRCHGRKPSNEFAAAGKVGPHPGATVRAMAVSAFRRAKAQRFGPGMEDNRPPPGPSTPGSPLHHADLRIITGKRWVRSHPFALALASPPGRAASI